MSLLFIHCVSGTWDYQGMGAQGSWAGPFDVRGESITPHIAPRARKQTWGVSSQLLGFKAAGPQPHSRDVEKRRESFLGETGGVIWKITLLLHLLHVFLQSTFWAEMSGKQ